MNHPVKLKVCGITNEADALACAQAGVDYLGYITNYTTSPRFIVPTAADKIIQRVKQFYPSVQQVAVLVAPTDAFVSQLEGLSFDLIQVYGDLPQSHLPIWRSIVLRSTTDLQLLDGVGEGVAAVHCDAGLGSGNSINDEVLKKIDVKLPLVIAGGINRSNIREILAACSPKVVDVNSGVESAPGKKDLNKIYELQRLISN